MANTERMRVSVLVEQRITEHEVQIEAGLGREATLLAAERVIGLEPILGPNCWEIETLWVMDARFRYTDAKVRFFMKKNL